MLYRISCLLEFRLLKRGENPIFLELVVSDALLQTLLPFPHPLLSLLIFYGFARIKGWVLLFGLHSAGFALLFCVEHQTCLVQQWDCLEIQILCSRKQLLNIAFMCSVQIFTVKYLKTWWALCTSLWSLLFHSCWLDPGSFASHKNFY